MTQEHDRHEEFALACPNCTKTGILEVFQAQCESHLSGGELYCSVAHGLTVYPVYDGTTDSDFSPLPTRPIDYLCPACGFSSPTLLAFRLAGSTTPVGPSPRSPLHVVRSGKLPLAGTGASVHLEPPAKPASTTRNGYCRTGARGLFSPP